MVFSTTKTVRHVKIARKIFEDDVPEIILEGHNWERFGNSIIVFIDLDKVLIFIEKLIEYSIPFEYLV